MRILLVLPPMAQLNGAYPSTAFLTGFLRSRGLDCRQADLSLALALRLFSRRGLTEVATVLEHAEKTPAVESFLAQRERYADVIDAAIAFLQGRDPALAWSITSRRLLPEGPRFAELDDDEEALNVAFGLLGLQDRARHLASLLIDDLADAVRDGVDSDFGLSRYGERLVAGQPRFDVLAETLAREPTVLDRWLAEEVEAVLRVHEPTLLGVSAPFPGNAPGAFRVAQVAKSLRPGLVTVLGGGWPNTELRTLSEPRVFDAFDYVTLDDGERPLLALLDRLQGGSGSLVRTYFRSGGQVVYETDPAAVDVRQSEVGTPTWEGLPRADYLGLLELLNPMHRLWSDPGWNKLLLAHGCYWKKCSFCDVTLDYIARYDSAGAPLIVDRMDAVSEETGQRGFHFVDEAAPPALLRALSVELVGRGRAYAWWTNIRFERAFTPDLCEQMAAAGCIAVTGGLEVASDRLLARMQKGVTVAQVARVGRAFAEAGILVHAYLMYGFPTQTVQETVDSLERVRQLFEEGCLQSAFWHRFAATAHSPIGQDPAAFGITVTRSPGGFVQNDLAFTDPTGVDHDRLGVGLERALYNYLHGAGLEEDVRRWFDGDVPETTVDADFVARALAGVAAP